MFLVHPIQVTAAVLFFQLFISQRSVHNLEWNRKNSVCIGIKNVANL